MPAEVFAVTDDVLCVRRASYLTCSYLIRAELGIVSIDSGMKTDGSDLLAGLAHWGVEVGDVRSMFITH